MRFKIRVCIIVTVLLMAGLASAATGWNAADPNDVLKGYADWNKATNWTAGIPGVTDSKGVFSGNVALECRVTGTALTFADLAVGDNGSTVPGRNLLRVMDGGTIKTTGGWAGVSYNTPGKLIVEEGGLCDFTGHFWIGVSNTVNSLGNVVINGGTIQNGGSFNIGCALAPGTVTISKGGLLNMNRGETVFIQPGSVMDIDFGTFVIGGDRTASCLTYKTDGRLKGFGVSGNVVYDYNVTNFGKTTVTAIDLMNRAPVYTLVLPGSRALTWTNMAPIAPATDVWVDVWFGTDPNKLNPATYTKVLTKSKNATTVTVPAPLGTEDPTTYYWQVDSYLKGDPALIGDPNVTATGLVTPFEVTGNTPPSVDPNTLRTATWIGEWTEIKMIVTDNGSSAVTVTWSAADTSGTDAGPIVDPNITWTAGDTGPAGIKIEGGNKYQITLPAGTTYPATVSAKVAIDYHAAQMSVTATVADGNPSGLTDAASVVLDCAIDACQATTGPVNLDDQHKGDVELDCQLNLSDFAVFARNWLMNYQLTAPVPQ
jgi:hypothetical protein